MIIDMSQYNKAKEAEEQARQRIAAGKDLTLRCLSSDLKWNGVAFGNLPCGLHILTPQDLSNLQLGSYPLQNESALARSVREHPEVWATLGKVAHGTKQAMEFEMIEQMVDKAIDGAEDATVEALHAFAPHCASALHAAFKMFDVIKFIALIKLEDKTIAAMVANRLKRHYLLHSRAKGNVVEVGIQQHKSGMSLPFAQPPI